MKIIVNNGRECPLSTIKTINNIIRNSIIHARHTDYRHRLFFFALHLEISVSGRIDVGLDQRHEPSYARLGILNEFPVWRHHRDNDTNQFDDVARPENHAADSNQLDPDRFCFMDKYNDATGDISVRINRAMAKSNEDISDDLCCPDDH